MPRASLTPAAIVAAARRVADDEGITELSLRRVATELGTGPASLYRHIADRRQLLHLLADDLATGYPLTETGGSPIQQVVRQWHAMHDYLVAHPWGARVIADGEYALSSARPIAEHCVAQLTGTGLDHDAAVAAYRALWHLLLGHQLNAHPFGHLHGATGDDTDLDRTVRWLVAGARAEAAS